MSTPSIAAFTSVFSGYWGVNYLRVFNELAGSRVVAICDPRLERLQEMGRRYPDAILTTNIEDALALDVVDAAVICTGATTHFEVARKCLMAGKHILVEKPMATTVADAQTLIACAEAD